LSVLGGLIGPREFAMARDHLPPRLVPALQPRRGVVNPIRFSLLLIVLAACPSTKHGHRPDSGNVGIDAPSDRPPDSTADKPVDLVMEGPAQMDAPLADAPADGSADGQQCQSPMVWHYDTPGCDGQATRTCGRSNMDLCLGKILCGCDGQDIGICEFSTKPWRYEGSCSGTDARGDGQ
jgi:hypothetical protein